MEKQSYAGMTINERLFVSGLLDEFEKAVKENNRQLATDILAQLSIGEENIKTVIDSLIK
jgi:hypothetical protein